MAAPASKSPSRSPPDGRATPAISPIAILAAAADVAIILAIAMAVSRETFENSRLDTIAATWSANCTLQGIPLTVDGLGEQRIDG